MKYSIPFGVWVALCFGILYCVGATTGIQGSDSSEFVLAASSSTRVHPPGYPILVLWLKLFQWLSDNPMWNAAVATACLSACSMGVLASAVHRLIDSRMLTAWVVMLAGVQPLWLRYSTIPEAFAILGLVYSLFIWVGVVPSSRQSAVVFSLAVMVGIGSHHLFILSAPLIIFNCWKLRSWWPFILVGIVLGFSSYWLLMIQSGGWGSVVEVSDLIRFFLRMDYGTFQITHHTEIGTWWETPLQYLLDWSRDSIGIFPVALLAGLVGAKRTTLNGVTALSWVLCSVVILAVFQLPTTHAYLVHSNRFFMAPTVLSIPLIAQGLQIIYQQVIKYRTVLQVSWGVPILMLGVNIPIMGRFDSRMQDWISHACTVLPDNAMVFAAGDGAVFGLQLAQAQLRMCGHVDVVFPKLLVYQWYQKDLVDRGIQGEDMTSIIRMQPPDRPIFSVLGLSNQKGLPSSFPFAGVWMKFVPNANMLPAPKQVVDQLSHYAQQYPVSESLHPFLESRTAERWPAEQWAHSWWSLVPAFEAMEDLSSADISRDRGERWLPQE